MADVVAIRYRAFLSYSHHDKAWATWLHGSLESYRVDHDLIGRDTALGPVPNTLRPIFCDRHDFSAGHSLTEQTRATLASSRCLVVICSPSAVKSRYVNEEIRQFKALGGTHRIIPIIVDGEPNNPERECFPPALRFKVTSEGELTNIPEEPIAADARAQGDGKKLALLKVVSGLIGLGLDEVVRRAEMAHRRRNRIRCTVAAVLAVLFTGASCWAYAIWAANEQLQDQQIAYANEDAEKIARWKREGERVDKLVEELGTVKKRMDGSGLVTLKGQYIKTQILIILASTYQTLGDTKKSLEHAQSARDILQALLAAEESEPEWRRVVRGYYERLTGISQPSRADLQSKLALAYQKIGNSLLYRDRVGLARDAYTESLELARRVRDADPGKNETQSALSLSYLKIGDVWKALSNPAEARKSYEDSLGIRLRLAEASSDDSQLWRDLASVYDRLADTWRMQGKFDEALERERLSRDIVVDFLRKQPNDDWRRDLLVDNLKLAIIHREKGELSVALDGYRENFERIKQLTDRDPKNTELRRDLWSWHTGIGIVLAKQGELLEAEKNFRSAIDVLDNVAGPDPNNTDWQLALAQTFEQLAGILVKKSVPVPDLSLVAEGAGTSSNSSEIFSEALSYYSKSLKIKQDLVAKDTENLTWQYELAVVHANVATVRWTQGDLAQKRNDFDIANQLFEQALKEFELAKDLLEQVSGADPVNNSWRDNLDGVNKWIARMDGKLGNESKLREAGRNRAGAAVDTAGAKRDSDAIASDASLAPRR